MTTVEKTLQEKYDLLCQAINDDAQDCDPECDSFGHTEDCDDRSNFAQTIIRQQEIINRVALIRLDLESENIKLRAVYEAADALLRTDNPVTHELLELGQAVDQFRQAQRDDDSG